MQLASDEHHIYDGHPSWRSTLDFYIKGLLVVLVGGGIGYAVKGTGIAAAAAGAILAVVLIVGFLRRLATTYRISNQRLHIRRGIIARRVQETRLDRVQNVNVTQGVLERILQIGSVDFDTAGSGDSDFAFRGVAQPEQVQRAVEQAQREFAGAQQGGLGGGTPVAPPPTVPPA